MGDQRVRVLIAEDRREIARAVEMCTEALQLRTTSVNTVKGARRKMDETDILLLSLDLANGSADILLSDWIEKGKGPICVLSDNHLPLVEETCLNRRGVDNVLKTPDDMASIQSILHRYVKSVLRDRRISALEQRVKLLTYVVGGQLVLLAGKELGPALWELIKPLLLP